VFEFGIFHSAPEQKTRNASPRGTIPPNEESFIVVLAVDRRGRCDGGCFHRRELRWNVLQADWLSRLFAAGRHGVGRAMHH
jgi:hypothetical protein